MITGEELENDWPAKTFEDAYKDMPEGSLCECFALAEGEREDPDRASLIVVRLFIEGECLRKQKYIAGLRFYNFGDMATIDIVSLDKHSHSSIAEKHALRMDWQVDSFGDFFLSTYQIPMFIAGGLLEADKGNFNFEGSSADYGKNFFGTEVNDVARQLFFLSGLCDAGSKQGMVFIENLLQFMLRNKLRPDFYETFVGQYVSARFTGQNFGSLLTMKVLDRSVSEKNNNLLGLFAEEITGGFANKALLNAVCRKK